MTAPISIDAMRAHVLQFCEQHDIEVEWTTKRGAYGSAAAQLIIIPRPRKSLAKALFEGSAYALIVAGAAWLGAWLRGGLGSLAIETGLIAAGFFFFGYLTGWRSR